MLKNRSKSPKLESYLRRRSAIFNALRQFTIEELQAMYVDGLYLSNIRDNAMDVLCEKMKPLDFQQFVNSAKQL